MDIQKQIAFEKFHAKECNCDYNELKRRLDHQEKVMGHRYIPSSPRHEAWLVWDAAWQAKAQAVPEGFVLVPYDVVDRCMSHIVLAQCHPNNTSGENNVMEMDLKLLEQSIEQVQEQSNESI